MTAARCTHCGSVLTITGCPGQLPLLDPYRDGRQWGTRAQLSHHLGYDVTPAMLNNWRQRDGLERCRIGREVYSPVAQAASIEAAKRLAMEDGGRGRARRLDPSLVAAA
ncbi:hypothetical protein [Micromonospora humida]|uniref:hypothetical protein n=1 Tax=Micromonospora humida TaxID=2809018 RepID=UPI003427AAB1